MAARNSLKTPINKALLTPCRRIGLSKPKKTPKQLNLDSPGTPNVSHNFSKGLESKVTPLNTPKKHEVDSPRNQCVISPLISPLAKPLINNFAGNTLDLATKPPESKPATLNSSKTGNFKQLDVASVAIPIDSNPPNYNNKIPLNKATMSNKKAKRLFEDQKETIKKEDNENKELVKKLKDNLANKVKKIEKPLRKNYFSDSEEDTFKKTDNKKRRKAIKVIDSSSDESENEKSQEKLPDIEKHKETKLMKKPPIFRNETTSITNRESLGNSPLPIGKFTTSDWLDEDEFRQLREKEFVWKKDDKENVHSDSEEENFNVGKGKAAKVINSKSKLENLQENLAENIDNIKIISQQNKPIQHDVSSDDDFLKEPIRLRKKSSTMKEKRTSSIKNEKHYCDRITKSKKLKKEVTVNLEKIDETVLKNHNIDSIVPDMPEDNKKDKEKLLNEVNAMKSLIKKKEQILENLKQAEIYMNKHDPKKLNDLTNIWLNGCRQAIHDLLELLKQHGPITMRSLLLKLQISPEILDKLHITLDDNS